MKINVNNARQETGATQTAAMSWKEKLLYNSINIGQNGVTIPVREFIRKWLFFFFTNIFWTFYFMFLNLNFLKFI